MLSPKSLTLCLTLLLCSSGVSGCAKPASALQTYPPASLLGAEPKPVPSIDILTSAQAAARYNIAVESWGTRGWDQVKALCIWAKARGMPDAPCR